MKKIFKKCFAILLTLIIVLSVNTASFAAVPSASANAYASQSVTLKFEFAHIAGISGTFSYTNPNLFSSVKFRIEGLTLGKYNEKNKSLAFLGSSPVDCTVFLDLTIASNAKIGDSCGITLKYETTADGNMPSVPDYKYDTITVNVVEKLDHSSLKSAIEQAESLKKSSYTPETWSALESALTNAKTVLNSATTQSTINQATQSLINAIGTLEKLPDYNELTKQIKIAEALKKDDYIPNTWDALSNALAAANNAKNSKNQTEIDAAAVALKNAISGLISIYEGKLKLDDLNEQIAIAQGLNANDYEVDGWNVLAAALANAVKMKDSKLQPEIDIAASELKNAINNLKKIDYTKLSAALDAVNTYFGNTDLFDLLNNSSNLLNEANNALTSRNQQIVDENAQKLEDYLVQIKKAVAELTNTDSVIVEKPITVEPEKYCNIKFHKVWILLFWISFSVNIVGAVMVFLYFNSKKKLATDDTPLVDYDITDDYKPEN